MNENENIRTCYAGALNYPDLARKLNAIGIESYTVDAASSIILYRFKDGKNILHHGDASRNVSEYFDEQKTAEAIRNNQKGKSDYAGFMNEIAQAGVRFYEATLSGDRKRVTYVGSGGSYEEAIPW